MFRENWGKQLKEVVKPVVVVLDIASGACHILTPPTRDLSLGKARWVPGSNEQVVFVGYENDPKKLGFIYCVNRR